MQEKKVLNIYNVCQNHWNILSEYIHWDEIRKAQNQMTLPEENLV